MILGTYTLRSSKTTSRWARRETSRAIADWKSMTWMRVMTLVPSCTTDLNTSQRLVFTLSFFLVIERERERVEIDSTTYIYIYREREIEGDI